MRQKSAFQCAYFLWLLLRKTVSIQTTYTVWEAGRVHTFLNLIRTKHHSGSCDHNNNNSSLNLWTKHVSTQTSVQAPFSTPRPLSWHGQSRSVATSTTGLEGEHMLHQTSPQPPYASPPNIPISPLAVAFIPVWMRAQLVILSLLRSLGGFKKSRNLPPFSQNIIWSSHQKKRWNPVALHHQA